ncbi:hypothetical protein GBA52_020154 [Prunus armeniaca]|nr:hypothetical protein GBA52_020154 [Prunus armeniaca]
MSSGNQKVLKQRTVQTSHANRCHIHTLLMPILHQRPIDSFVKTPQAVATPLPFCRPSTDRQVEDSLQEPSSNLETYAMNIVDE